MSLDRCVISNLFGTWDLEESFSLYLFLLCEPFARLKLIHPIEGIRWLFIYEDNFDHWSNVFFFSYVHRFCQPVWMDHYFGLVVLKLFNCCNPLWSYTSIPQTPRNKSSRHKSFWKGLIRIRQIVFLGQHTQKSCLESTTDNSGILNYTTDLQESNMELQKQAFTKQPTKNLADQVGIFILKLYHIYLLFH